jgi:hypothetical protein
MEAFACERCPAVTGPAPPNFLVVQAAGRFSAWLRERAWKRFGSTQICLQGRVSSREHWQTSWADSERGGTGDRRDKVWRREKEADPKGERR